MPGGVEGARIPMMSVRHPHTQHTNWQLERTNKRLQDTKDILEAEKQQREALLGRQVGGAGWAGWGGGGWVRWDGVGHLAEEANVRPLSCPDHGLQIQRATCLFVRGCMLHAVGVLGPATGPVGPLLAPLLPASQTSAPLSAGRGCRASAHGPSHPHAHAA